MEITLVLSVGFDPMLLGPRNVLLQSEGYTVVRAYSLKEAVNCFKSFDFDLVLLCQSIPRKEKGRLTSWIRASGSRIPVVSVSEKLGERDAFADATVDSDSEVLLMGMSEVLFKVANSAAWTLSSRKNDACVLTQKLFAAAQGKKPSKSIVNRQQQLKTVFDVRSLYCM